MSGISVRTLHYYDEIGLLKPAYYGDNGYRYYEEKELLRLQQILFFRELEIPLADIQSILESEAFDQLEALHAHKRLLQGKVERLQALLSTIDKTIDHLRGEIFMNHDEMYKGFDKEKQEKYVQELKEMYGEESEKYIRESMERTEKWDKKDWDKVKSLAEQIGRELMEAIEQELPVEDPKVQSAVQKHYEWINLFYTPTKEVYVGLGDLYVDHPDFRKFYEQYHPNFPEYLRDAMRVYAERNLE